ncbi:hypothetical protein CDAR_247651 [Caerostris darwini]|uniref:Uncharacterized protein n=1 Tax=Caerostris darwini TaxID=1538125 RepID=A0AAV4T958_9ARAC|nr:hypothetical protein CDAR_247651 [Caerostris darwini]
MAMCYEYQLYINPTNDRTFSGYVPNICTTYRRNYRCSSNTPYPNNKPTGRLVNVKNHLFVQPTDETIGVLPVVLLFTAHQQNDLIV